MDKRRMCPACRGENAVCYEPLEHGAFYRCVVCAFQFVDPPPAGVPLFIDFAAAGEAMFKVLNGASIIPSLTSGETAALQWLDRQIPGGTILELCCESGRFLAALKEKGFKAYGADPLESHVQLLMGKGFQVSRGMAEEIPKEWPEPDAVVILESLVRFPDPASVIRDIRRRFPKARVLLVLAGKRSLFVPQFERRHDYPPHHLARWTAAALTALLENAGYRGHAKSLSVNLHVFRGSLINRLLKMGFWLFLHGAGASEESLLAWGEPR